MFPFDYYIPTKVLFGEGRVSEVGEVTKEFGKKAMVVSYEEDFIKSIGLYDKVVKPLKAAGIEVVEHFGVLTNPDVGFIRAGVALCEEQGVDVLVALGGGSVIDTAKAIGVSVFSKADAWDIASGKAEMTGTLPLVTISTIPATSSEMNPTSVISNDKIRRKEGFASPIMFPKVSILDPELTYTLPMKLTAISAADIVSHLMEGYINHTNKWSRLQDNFAQSNIRIIMECMDILLKDPTDKKARAMFMWTAAFAWNGFYVCGIGPHSPAIHMLGHSFSAFYGTPHGSAMSVSIPAVMNYHFDERIEKHSEFAREVFGFEGEDSAELARKGIDALVDWFKKIDVPTTLEEAKIPTDEFDAMADDVLLTAEHWGIDIYDKKMVLELLEGCK